jgi:hypothetical protein
MGIRKQMGIVLKMKYVQTAICSPRTSEDYHTSLHIHISKIEGTSEKEMKTGG